jgi:DNA-directed RNA polymerase specialized sigma24 family protein
LDQEKVEILKIAMVNILTSLEMRIFINYYIEGYTITDIAEFEGKEKDNIRTRLYQARVKLKKELAGDR